MSRHALRLIVFLAWSTLLTAQPAPMVRFVKGPMPDLPSGVIGGGEVLAELTLSPIGRVTGITPLRTTPPFTDLLVGAVREWEFAPIQGDRETHVLVAAVFRAPVLLGPTLGAIPRDAAAPSSAVAFPTTTVVPPFPPMAAGGGVVLIDAEVDQAGSVVQARAIRSQPPFDEAAIAAARQWTFRPPAPQPLVDSTHVFIVFGFPVPIGAPVEKKP